MLMLLHKGQRNRTLNGTETRECFVSGFLEVEWVRETEQLVDKLKGGKGGTEQWTKVILLCKWSTLSTPNLSAALWIDGMSVWVLVTIYSFFSQVDNLSWLFNEIPKEGDLTKLYFISKSEKKNFKERGSKSWEGRSERPWLWLLFQTGAAKARLFTTLFSKHLQSLVSHPDLPLLDFLLRRWHMPECVWAWTFGYVWLKHPNQRSWRLDFQSQLVGA